MPLCKCSTASVLLILSTCVLFGGSKDFLLLAECSLFLSVLLLRQTETLGKFHPSLDLQSNLRWKQTLVVKCLNELLLVALPHLQRDSSWFAIYS